MQILLCAVQRIAQLARLRAIARECRDVENKLNSDPECVARQKALGPIGNWEVEQSPWRWW